MSTTTTEAQDDYAEEQAMVAALAGAFSAPTAQAVYQAYIDTGCNGTFVDRLLWACEKAMKADR